MLKRISTRRADFLIPSATSDETYITSWDFSNNTNFCTCKGFFYRRKCRHVLEALASLSKEELRKLSDAEWDKEDWIPTSLDGINHLTSLPDRPETAKGLPIGIPVCFYGFHESLKTATGMQFAADAIIHFDENVGDAKNALIIDTETGLSRFGVPFWARVLSKRYEYPFGVKEYRFVGGEMQERRERAKGKGTIYTCKIGSFDRILSLHGVDVLFKTSNPKEDKKQSKVILDLKNFKLDIEHTVIGKFVKEHNIGYILYDSISSPLKGPFIGSQQNQPSRAQATHSWLIQVHELADLFDVAVVGTVHASGNPQAFRGTPGSMQRPNPVGGSAVLHSFKIVLYFQTIEGSTTKRAAKKIWLERCPWRDPWDGTGYKIIKITDAGIIDIGEKDL